jgi:hypothetical protein
VAATGGTVVLVGSHAHRTPDGAHSSVVTVSSGSPSAAPRTTAASSRARSRPARQPGRAHTPAPKPSPGSRGIGACVSAVANAGPAGSDGGVMPAEAVAPDAEATWLAGQVANNGQATGASAARHSPLLCPRSDLDGCGAHERPYPNRFARRTPDREAAKAIRSPSGIGWHQVPGQ